MEKRWFIRSPVQTKVFILSYFAQLSSEKRMNPDVFPWKADDARKKGCRLSGPSQA